MGYSRSRAKCVPLQYLSSSTRGVKQALCKPYLNQNLLVESTPLQEKINISDLSFTNKEILNQVSQSESGMFCELLNKKGMECEKYQDCSWFQQNSMKPDCRNKLSPAEIFDPFIDANEFNLSMQCAEAHMSPWGDEYLEVFTDDILDENYRLKEKKNLMNISSENFYDTFGGGQNFDMYNESFNLKKSDSMDSIKNISLTNPAEVIPISYKEKLNNPNYGLTKLDKVKSEIKQEMHSPDSTVYLVDSDDSDLNIGREEEVEEMISAEDSKVVNKKETVNLEKVKFENSFDKVPSDYAVNPGNWEIKEDNEENKCKKIILPGKEENVTNKSATGKFDLNLDIAKLSFDQPLNLNTPDLDFMDLVDFINEEMHQEGKNFTSKSTPNTTIPHQSHLNRDVISTEEKSNAEYHQASDLPPSQVSLIKQDQSSPNETETQTSDKLSSSEKKNNSTVDFNVVSDTGVSIAERIKTSAKRKTRKSLKDLIDSEDDESCGSSDEDYDYRDDDYDYREDLVKRRCLPLKRRTKSDSVESTGDSKREGGDSYRERRDKNNEASRRSRQNRKARERHMYETLEEEERRNVKLKAEADVLEKQVTSLRQLLLQVVLRKGGAT